LIVLGCNFVVPNRNVFVSATITLGDQTLLQTSSTRRKPRHRYRTY